MSDPRKPIEARGDTSFLQWCLMNQNTYSGPEKDFIDSWVADETRPSTPRTWRHIMFHLETRFYGQDLYEHQEEINAARFVWTDYCADVYEWMTRLEKS